MEIVKNKVILTQDGKAYDISELVQDFEISGDGSQAIRKCSMNIIYPSFYSTRINPKLENSRIQIFINNDELYRGYITTKDLDANGQNIKLEIEDNILFIYRNDVTGPIKQQNDNNINQVFQGKPEDETRKLLNKFNLPVGDLASTGLNILYIAKGKTIYDVIYNMYKMASEQNGKMYHIYSNKDKISVIEKGAKKSGLKYNEDNIISIQYSESSANMVNKVTVFDSENNVKAVAENTKDIKKYGLLSKEIHGKDENHQKIANNNLKGLERKVNITVMGNVNLRTGYAVDVSFSSFGLNNTLYIESDAHTFAEGTYMTKLTLIYENKMGDDKDE